MYKIPAKKQEQHEWSSLRQALPRGLAEAPANSPDNLRKSVKIQQAFRKVNDGTCRLPRTETIEVLPDIPPEEIVP